MEYNYDFINKLDIENIFSKDQFEKFLNSLRAFINENQIFVSTTKSIDDTLWMFTDYFNGNYEGMDNKVIPIGCFSLLYFILPSSVMKKYIGEKTFFRSALVFSFAFFTLNSELKKYREFLDENKVVIATEYGDITYYRHRLKEEL
ncbi:hypothetical protein [uncultured Ezakiella sp.]|uniref:hypothetical protein n=1 Tax=uncultured Ezakiella sp. TaxID=1637529 RepID=UPI0025E67A50|nr:hypothetical protein [uncultured Ezakiella sp.]